VAGDVGKDEDGVLIIKRIHVRYELSEVGGEDLRVKAERAHRFHADKCAVARSIKGSIDITTELVFV